MVQSKNKLWVKLLSAKYSTGPNILQAKASSNSSPSWASIIRAKDIFIHGYSWRPGSGSSSFWFSSWCHHGLIDSLVPVIDIHDIHLTIRDVMSVNGQRTQFLYTTLPQSVTDTVNTFQANFNPSVDDAYIWSHNKNGVYSTKSGYSWLLSSMDSANIINPSNSWSWIWNLQVPEKFKFLLWLSIHDAVPTLSVLHHRNIAESAICSRCREEDESIMHCFWDCKFSKPIWQRFNFSDAGFFSSYCPQDWIKSNVNSSRSTVFLVCLWWSWRHRNNMCFNQDVWSITRLSINIQNSVETITKSFQSASNSAVLDRWITWNSSNYNCHILNVDGSCLGTPIRTGYGGLIRNSGGLFLRGFSGFIQDSTCILQAELTAIHQGLQLAVNMGIEDLVCYSDSQLSVKLISGDVSKFHAYAVLIQDIKDIIASHNFNILHTFREGNHCADFLAKLGASSNAVFLEHQSPPYDLIDKLRNDALGTCFLRA